MRRLPYVLLLLGIAVNLATPEAAAQEPISQHSAWTLRTSVLMSGASHASDPAGYKAYSGVALEAGLRRTLTRLLAAELTVRTESREVDSIGPAASYHRLGAVEFLPASLLLQLRLPFRGAVRPYVGAGVNLTPAWEKSGVLDSMDVKASVGPALQVGADWDVAPTVLLIADARWTRQTADISSGSSRLAKLDVDPLALSLGVGFRF